jgi:hypothetical protein
MIEFMRTMIVKFLLNRLVKEIEKLEKKLEKKRDKLSKKINDENEIL